MSIRLMTMVWDIRWPTQNHLLVMLKLADHANDEGSKVWPAVATIAAQAQCSERTVQNVLKAFRDCGLVGVVKPGGGASPTIYTLNVSLLNALASAKAQLEGSADLIEIPDEAYAQAADATGATIAPLGVAPVQPATRTGATDGGRGAKLLHPNHHLEPSKEPSGAQAREDSKSDLSEVKRPVATFVVTAADPQWEHWMVFLRSREQSQLEQRAIAAGEITTFGSRWPKADSPLPRVKQTGLTERSKQMAGGA